MFLGFCRKSANKAHRHWFVHLSIFILRQKLIINSPLFISFCRWLSAEMLFFLKKQRKHLMMPIISSQTFSTTRFSFLLNFNCTFLFFIQFVWSVNRKNTPEVDVTQSPDSYQHFVLKWIKCQKFLFSSMFNTVFVLSSNLFILIFFCI